MDVLLEELYESIVAPEHWPLVLDRLTKLCTAEAALLLVFGHAGLRWDSTPSPPPRIDLQLLTSWLNRNVLPTSQRFVIESIQDGDKQQPVLAAQGLGWLAATAIQTAGGETYCYVVAKSPGQLSFGSYELDMLEQLHPHLERATRLAVRRVKSKNSFAVDVLQAIHLGSVVLRADRSVVAANRHARSFTLGFSFTPDNKIEFADTRAQKRLLDALAQIADSPDAGLKFTIPIQRRTPTPPIIATILPIHVRRKNIFCEAVALLTAAPVSGGRAMSPHSLTELFALTPTEARVANELAKGESVREIARRHSVTPNTIRMQLKSIYGKTGTRRQTELVSVLANPPFC